MTRHDWGHVATPPRHVLRSPTSGGRRASPALFISTARRFSTCLCCSASHRDATPHSLTSTQQASRAEQRDEMSRLDARTLKDEVASMDRRPLLDLGHPLLNRVADSFIRAAGVGAARAVSKEAYFVTVEGLGGDSTGLDANVKRNTHFSSARGDDGQKSLDAVVKSAGKEAIQWGLAAGVYSGVTYGLREARGCHDWKNSAIAGALAGAAVALTGDTGHADHVVHFAITGAALSSAATMLSGIF